MINLFLMTVSAAGATASQMKQITTLTKEIRLIDDVAAVKTKIDLVEDKIVKDALIAKFKKVIDGSTTLDEARAKAAAAGSAVTFAGNKKPDAFKPTQDQAEMLAYFGTVGVANKEQLDDYKKKINKITQELADATELYKNAASPALALFGNDYQDEDNPLVALRNAAIKYAKEVLPLAEILEIDTSNAVFEKIEKASIDDELTSKDILLDLFKTAGVADATAETVYEAVVKADKDIADQTDLDARKVAVETLAAGNIGGADLSADGDKVANKVKAIYLAVNGL